MWQKKLSRGGKGKQLKTDRYNPATVQIFIKKELVFAYQTKPVTAGTEGLKKSRGLVFLT
jgi:hypothetical protein